MLSHEGTGPGGLFADARRRMLLFAFCCCYFSDDHPRTCPPEQTSLPHIHGAGAQQRHAERRYRRQRRPARVHFFIGSSDPQHAPADSEGHHALHEPPVFRWRSARGVRQRVFPLLRHRAERHAQTAGEVEALPGEGNRIDGRAAGMGEWPWGGAPGGGARAAGGATGRGALSGIGQRDWSAGFGHRAQSAVSVSGL